MSYLVKLRGGCAKRVRFYPPGLEVVEFAVVEKVVPFNCSSCSSWKEEFLWMSVVAVVGNTIPNHFESQ